MNASTRLVALLFACLAFASVGAVNTNHRVILMTIDGFPASMLHDPVAGVPTLKRLAREGVYAENGMRVSNPSVTWPNHTTLMTGVEPARHSVLFNGVLVRGAAGVPVRVDGFKDKADLVAVPALFDLLHKAGYRSAAINWPCTRNSGTLEEDFPDTPNQLEFTTPRLRQELVSAGVLPDETQKTFASLSAARRDQVWTAAAVNVIERRKPNFMLFHLLVCDATHHKYGAQSMASYTATALADAHLGQLLAALERAGIKENTTLFVVSDHGFEKALKIANPNVLFRKAGLLETRGTPNILQARAQIISEGGIAMVYLTDRAQAARDANRVREVLAQAEGIAEILGPDRYAEFGFPDPAANPQMADLVLVAAQGYAFGNLAAGEDYITEVTLNAGNQGHHGYLHTNPKMNALFVAWGRGIKRGATIPQANNIDVAPTIARLLGVQMPNTTGRAMTQILE